MVEPIFVDSNARPADYDHLERRQLLVTSIFPTIQGEGPFAGRRCVFLRLAGCNLGGKGVTGPGCDFCDTDFRMQQGKALSFDEIYGQIVRLLDDIGGKRLIVITGGEPMMQENLVGFLKFGMQTPRFIFQIESNGTRLLPIPVTGVYLVVSPKIPVMKDRLGTPFPSSSSYYHELNKRILDRADCLKFVVDSASSSPYHEIPDYALRFNQRRSVYVSPIAVYKREVLEGEVASIWTPGLIDWDATKANHAYAASLAMEHGFIVSIQMHLYLTIP